MNDSPRRGLVAAAIVFTVSLFVFGSALVRALGTDTATPLAEAAGDADGTAPLAAEALSTEALMLAIDNDPFQPTRERPAERYRLPGDVDPEPPPPPAEPSPLPPFFLQGTIVAAEPTRSIALIQLGEDGTPALLPVGSTLAGFRVAEVTREAVVMTDGERQVWLRVPGPQQTVAAAPPLRLGNNNSRERNNSRSQPIPEAAERVRQQVMQMMQQLQAARQAGASPEVLQAMQQAIERAANQAGDNVRIRVREVAPVRRAVPDTSSTSAPGALDHR